MNRTVYRRHPNPPITNATMVIATLCMFVFVAFPPLGIFLVPIPLMMHKRHRATMHAANAAARRRAEERRRQTRILALKSLPL